MLGSFRCLQTYSNAAKQFKSTLERIKTCWQRHVRIIMHTLHKNLQTTSNTANHVKASWGVSHALADACTHLHTCCTKVMRTLLEIQAHIAQKRAHCAHTT
jgi:hypothetical protein